MTVHRTVPSEVEPDTLADLWADCAALPARLLPAPAPARTIDLTALPRPRRAIEIPAVSRSLSEGYAEHFV